MVPELATAECSIAPHFRETGSKFHNDIDRALSAFRDVHMYRLLARAWAGGRYFAESDVTTSGADGRSQVCFN